MIELLAQAESMRGDENERGILPLAERVRGRRCHCVTGRRLLCEQRQRGI